VSVDNLSFYTGYHAAFDSVSINIGVQMMPFVKYGVLESTAPYIYQKDVGDMKAQSKNTGLAVFTCSR